MEGQKQRQIAYHERAHYLPEILHEPDNRSPVVASLNTYRLRKMLQLIETPIAGKSILSVSGGDGVEADCLQRQGAVVTVTDLSSVAIENARLRNPSLRCLRMDSEMLGFADNTFDWVIVRDGLHHLERPLKGFYELERVSREGFVVLEGQDSWLVRFLVKLRLGSDWDPAGGYVYRFGRRELQKVFHSLQTVSRWRIYTAWLPPGSDLLNHFPEAKPFIQLVIQRPYLLQLLTARYVRPVLKVLFKVIQSVAGRWGNSLIVVAWKKSDITR